MMLSVMHNKTLKEVITLCVCIFTLSFILPSKQLEHIQGFIATCFDFRQSSSGYTNNHQIFTLWQRACGIPYPYNVFTIYVASSCIYYTLVIMVKWLACACKFIYFTMTLYMFRTVFPSIIRSSRLYIQQQAFVKQILFYCCQLACGYPLASREQYLFEKCLLLYVQS